VDHFGDQVRNLKDDTRGLLRNLAANHTPHRDRTMPATPYRNFPHLLIEHDPITSSKDKVEAKTHKVIPKKDFSTKYLKEITTLLDTIASTKVGLALLSSLERAGKDVKIRFPKLFVATYMKCDGGAPNTSKTLGNPFREPIGTPDPLSVLQEAVRKSGLSARSIASFIGDAAESGGADLKINKDIVAAWLNGSKELPKESDRGYRYLVLALEPWLDHGSGAKVTVEYDPWNELTGESTRPAHVGLFHELVHAWYYVSGRQVFTDDHTENERMIIGLPGFDIRATGHHRLYTENRYRDELGMGPRLKVKAGHDPPDRRKRLKGTRPGQVRFPLHRRQRIYSLPRWRRLPHRGTCMAESS